MEARKLCPPETFSVINHNQIKLLAYNYWRQKEGYNIMAARKLAKLQGFEWKKTTGGQSDFFSYKSF